MFAVQLWVSMLLVTFGITMAIGARKPAVPHGQERNAELLQRLPAGSLIEARHARRLSLSALH